MNRSLLAALRTPAGALASAVLLLVVGLAVFGPVLAPYPPNQQDAAAILQGPSAAHWLGTDYVGRDVLSRILAGSTLSVLTAVEAVGIGLVLGVVPGITSVYFGRVYEWLTLRLMDGLLALPFMIFAIAVAALLGNGLQQAMLAVGILLAPGFYRITRSAALGFTNTQYATAAELFGSTTLRTIRVHIWGKIAPVIVVATANAIGGGLLIVASLTFLGIGVQPPEPTWGGMLASDLGYLYQRPYGPLIPSLLIMATVGALNWLADAIRDTSGDLGRARIAAAGADERFAVFRPGRGPAASDGAASPEQKEVADVPHRV
ncbi:ABC transporter permease [Microbacterium marinilacus]|uniref:ABC transporter permease n=1 Tax=Microbacterium marinilacus TaxID=415209 RepID=A0ABP7BC00_9MICO|nr:ABC transporter permease [Microbacterium marinilacus]MBY0690230.1 ABC transporter permease [Microbacterium marinilacus]